MTGKNKKFIISQCIKTQNNKNERNMLFLLLGTSYKGKMKKVLIVMDDINYRGGAHFVTFNIANTWCENEINVSIFSPVKANKETLSYLNERIEILEKEEYKGFDYVIVPFENSIFKEKVCQLTGIKKIQWIHIDYKYWTQKIDADLIKEREIYKNFDCFVFVSEGAKAGFVEIFPEYEKKCKTIYNLVEEKKIKQKSLEDIDEEIFNKKPEELNVLLVGRLEPQKAYDRAIDVAKILKDKKNINWFFLGKGYQYEELKERCKKYNLNNVKFLGYRENPYAYMRHADIVGLLSEYEGFGLTVVEGMLSGTPVLATKSTGVDEIFDVQGGWIIDNNLFAIIDQLEKIIENSFEYEKKKEYLKTYKYDNRRIKRQLIELFDGPEEMSEKYMEYNVYKDNPKVSIIVPVYNMESYLAECLDTLVEQSLDEIEIIVINDGSTDRSQEIIDDYVYRFSDKIRAFSIPNSGLGMARNYGIKKARGKYVGFVDSDDVVDLKMYEKLYKFALKEKADCIICDYIAFWEDGKKEYVHSLTKKSDRFEIIKQSTKYGVVNAVTKLFDIDLIREIPFPRGFYEDLATIPIWLTYANKIAYLSQGLYYYRQRSGSITSIKSGDERLKGVYDCWNRILKESNLLFKKEIRYAVYWSLDFFSTNFLDRFTKYSQEYYLLHKHEFEHNEYIEEAIKNDDLLNFGKLDKIPKVIHYCWFGKGEKSQLILMCIESWKKYAPDFEIIEWNEDNCNINENDYVKKAYENKKWAFVSDYFRLKVLYEMGGVYLDTDMELMKPLEPCLYHNAFFAFETPIFIHAGIIGAVSHHNLIYKIMTSYQNDEFCIGVNDTPKTIPMRITEILSKDTNLVKNGKMQTLNGNIKLYSANMMTVNFSDGMCIANHHYDGNWLDKDAQKSSYNYRYEVLKHYFTWDLIEKLKKLNVGIVDGECNCLSDFEQAKFKHLFNEVISSTSWKITKPLRKVMDYLRGKKSTQIDLKGIYDYKQLYEQAISSTSWKITKPLRSIKDSLMRKG